MEADGGWELQAPWMNKNKYYLLQPYYMPVLNLYYKPQYYMFFYLFVHYSFNSCMNCFLFIHLFNSEYLGTCPSSRGFLPEDSEDFILSPGQGGKAVNQGKKSPFGGHRGEKT